MYNCNDTLSFFQDLHLNKIVPLKCIHWKKKWFPHLKKDFLFLAATYWEEERVMDRWCSELQGWTVIGLWLCGTHYSQRLNLLQATASVSSSSQHTSWLTEKPQVRFIPVFRTVLLCSAHLEHMLRLIC